ncbi:molybdenum cofactor biosynthesis protein MoaE [Pseudoxanthomonas suwonensis]|uniref:Molybdopterin synthase catalytic subunit n=1 Tax=Pseudoxanthomonas suwonensis TaxID=314722 RepID=A0A0E3YZW4_9GAMM|nr:molybdenum cofactor biosynthesis protein MoaE [Pseudoxanthomonas suwonensis]AKC85734.1 molybdopterin-converting factor chain 2 [Pseudoxanthomonas suwonensis]
MAALEREPGEPVLARFELAEAPFDVAALRTRLLRDEAGAYASFEGWVRDHNEGRPVLGLRYEAYAALAAAEGQRIVEEAVVRFGACGVHCVHRTGELAIGELAVWVGASAAHRDAAFAACRFVIDEVKARVPIWKHERYADGARQWLHPQPAPAAREPAPEEPR